MTHMPCFATDEEAAEWYDTHDTAPYMDDMEGAQHIPVARTRPLKKPVGLRLRLDCVDAIKRIADEKGVPYQTLIQMWLMERIRQEAPDLLP